MLLTAVIAACSHGNAVSSPAAPAGRQSPAVALSQALQPVMIHECVSGAAATAVMLTHRPQAAAYVMQHLTHEIDDRTKHLLQRIIAYN
jgi:hypothetical protein